MSLTVRIRDIFFWTILKGSVWYFTNKEANHIIKINGASRRKEREHFMEMKIYRDNMIPVYIQIKNNIKRSILDGELVTGFKLPSERVLAEQLGVHRNTVIKAYGELIADDLVKVSTLPKGYFITYAMPGIRQRNITKSNRYFKPFQYMVREEFLQMDSLFSELYRTSITRERISFAADIASPDAYPREELGLILKEMLETGKYDPYGFCDPQGVRALRENIAELLLTKQIKAVPREIQIISETYQAMDYLIKLFVSPGDTIVAEEPIITDTFHFFRLMGVNLITVPMDEDGMRTDCLESIIKKHNPKFIYTIPTFHFPSTTVMSLERRYELLDIAYKYNIPIIEEGTDSFLRYEGTPIPSLKSLDYRENVIYLDSLMDSFCPGARVSYMLATGKVIEKISRLLEINQIFINSIGQYLTNEFIEKGFYEQCSKKLCTYFAVKRDVMCDALHRMTDVDIEFNKPQGGTALWCHLSEAINQKKLLLNAHKSGVSFSPGYLFFPYGDQGESYMRLSYGYPSEKEIVKGIELLVQAVKMSR
jgi:2-aminoadipate transaminase